MFVGSYPEFSEDRWHETVQQFPEYRAASEILHHADSGLEVEMASPSRTTAIRPCVRIPEISEVLELSAFEEHQQSMAAMFVENGGEPDILWPLVDQYLQPMIFRYPLRSYMTSEDVSGAWLVERYVAYVAKGFTLAELSDQFFSSGSIGSSENEAFKEFIYTAVADFYALIMCAIETAGREQLVAIDGNAVELDPLELIRYCAILDEVVSAHDANDPLRLIFRES